MIAGSQAANSLHGMGGGLREAPIREQTEGRLMILGQATIVVPETPAPSDAQVREADSNKRHEAHPQTEHEKVYVERRFCKERSSIAR